ncbi:MAG: ATP-binding protein [Treponema sp.]|nr:ATP-binding protein [Treponema sp.]
MSAIRSFFNRARILIELYVKLLFVALAFLLMIVSSSYYVNNMLRKHLRRDAIDMLNQTKLKIEAEFIEPYTAMAAISEIIRSMILHGDDADKVLSMMKDLGGELGKRPDGFAYNGLYGYFDVFGGIYLTSSDWNMPEDYDPSVRPWFDSAVESGDTIAVTPIYDNLRMHEPIVTYVRRIYDDGGNPLAIVCLNMSLDRIKRYIKDMHLTGESYGILVNDRMDIVYHPDPQLVGVNADETSGFSQLMEMIKGQRDIPEREVVNHRGVVTVTFSTRLENGWIIYNVIPKNEYYRELYSMELILIALGAILTTALIFILVRIDRAKKKADEESRQKSIRLETMEKIREADERYQVMLDTTPICVNFINKDLKVIDCNREGVKLFGFSDKNEYMEKFWELSPEYQPCGVKSSELSLEYIKKVTEEGYCRFEWVHQILNGGQIPCEVTLVLSKYRDEDVILAYMRDLREIKAAIAEMREADERTQIMFNVMPLGCKLWNKDHKIIECNQEVLQLFGLEKKQEFFDRFFELMPEYQPCGRPSREMVSELLDDAFRDGCICFEWMHRKLDGELIPSEITLVRIWHKGEYEVAGYIRDLRELKQMMSKIEQRDNLLNTVNRAAVLLLTTENEENTTAQVLEAMEFMGRAVEVDRIQIWENKVINGTLNSVLKCEWLSEIGRSKAAIPGGFTLSYNTKPEWERKFSRGEYINGPLSELPPEDQELLRPYGIKSVVIIPLFLRDQFWGFFSLDDCADENAFSDDQISILRSGALLIANAFLRSEMTGNIRTAAVELETALKEAQEANRAKSKFLATMSHEIRTPMNVILGVTESQLLLEGYPPETKEAFEKIFDAGNLLLHIINDILDLSKIEAGKFELFPARYETLSLINDAANMNVMQFGFKQIKFKLHVDENIPLRMFGDELRLKQILNNLLSNAYKYTDSGEVALSISCENITQNENEAVMLVIHVADTGQGMTPEQIKRLFDEYSRFNPEANRTTVGTGLGMAITHNLVKMMDGSMAVDSTPGKGTLFTVRIPQGVAGPGLLGREAAENLEKFNLSTAAREKQMKIKREPMPYGRVLVVDDMKSNLDVAILLLKPYKLKIDTALSGIEAVEVIKNGNVYDMIFMDHMMPKMDGMETTKKIRALGYRHPIFALTANAVIGQKEIFLANGFDGYISKPIDIRQLNDALNKYIRDKERSRKGIMEKYSEEALFPSAPPPGTAGTDAVIEIPGIDTETGTVLYGGDQEIYLSVLRSFTANALTVIEKIRDVSKDTLADYNIKIHGFKGISANIGAKEISEKARELESMAKSGDLNGVLAKNGAFLKEAEGLLSRVQAWFEEHDSKNPRPVLERPDRELLARLQKSCEAYDMNGVDDVMEELDKADYNEGGSLLAWLRDKIKDLDFSAAAQRLSEYAQEPK